MKKFLTIAFTLLLATHMLVSQSSRLTEQATGIAPFAAFFDAVDPDSGVIQPELINNRRAYADFSYSWDFGDNTNSYWPNSNKSRNHDIGYIASHVYDSPGNYTVTLRVRDKNGSLHSYTQTITVQDPNLVISLESK